MRYFTGNIIDNYDKFDLIFITTNGKVKADGACVMGRGIAKTFKSLIPEIPFKIGANINKYGNRCFVLGKWKGVRLGTFPVKDSWEQKAKFNIIKISCKQAVELADKFGFKNIALPKPGCGNGQLDWLEVKEFIEPLLDDRFIICDLY